MSKEVRFQVAKYGKGQNYGTLLFTCQKGGWKLSWDAYENANSVFIRIDPPMPYQPSNPTKWWSPSLPDFQRANYDCSPTIELQNIVIFHQQKLRLTGLPNPTIMHHADMSNQS